MSLALTKVHLFASKARILAVKQKTDCKHDRLQIVAGSVTRYWDVVAVQDHGGKLNTTRLSPPFLYWTEKQEPYFTASQLQMEHRTGYELSR